MTARRPLERRAKALERDVVALWIAAAVVVASWLVGAVVPVARRGSGAIRGEEGATGRAPR